MQTSQLWHSSQFYRLVRTVCLLPCGLELVTRLPSRSDAFCWQFSSWPENSSRMDGRSHLCRNLPLSFRFFQVFTGTTLYGCSSAAPTVRRLPSAACATTQPFHVRSSGLFCGRPGGLELVTRVPLRSDAFCWQFSSWPENSSFLVLLANTAH